MGRIGLLVIDLCFIALATAFAVILRENFDVPDGRFTALVPYLTATLFAAVPILVAFGLNRAIWRLSAMPDYSRIVMAVVMIVVAAVGLGFTYNRLEGVSRSLPILQGILMAVSLIGIRALFRIRHSWRRRNKGSKTGMPELPGTQENVLVIGINRIAELYLQSIAEFAADRMGVAGLLGRSERHKGRLLQQHAVLGTPEDVDTVLRDLELHGVFVTRIVLTSAFSKLSPKARDALLEIEKTTNIRLQFFAEQLGLDEGSGADAGGDGMNEGGGKDSETPTGNDGEADPTVSRTTDKSGTGFSMDRFAFTITAPDMAAISQRPYWRLKRFFDAAAALFLLVILAPVTLLVAVLVALDLGLPVVFWQQRPGLGGRPFGLYKLRSMAASHDAQGRRVPDGLRSSGIGRFLRRTRLDELPQLWNILIGDMSFVGPRPLLPVDQPGEFAARLLVRPGLTGWAQIQGGRMVSAADKAALDVWYVCNASLLLDLRIMGLTLPMLLQGEQTNEAAVHQAWHDLQEAGICASRPR